MNGLQYPVKMFEPGGGRNPWIPAETLDGKVHTANLFSNVPQRSSDLG